MRSRLAGVVPGGFGDEDRMILRIAMEDLFQRVAKQVRDTLEVGDFGDEQKGRPFSSLHARRKGKYEIGHALNPSLMGFPICMPSRQTDGPCCPMYSLLSSL
jgi:hypothetical protein